MKTKLEMAHEYAVAMLRAGVTKESATEFAQTAFILVEAMQAEADKRLAEVECKEDWQPDWSQAPDDACCWFVGGKSWDVKPYWSKYIPCYKNEDTQTTWQGDGMVEAPSFGYKGDWRDSLRKRPN